MIDLFPTKIYWEKDIATHLQERLSSSITKLYNDKAYYPYMPLPNNLSQTIDVVGTKPGSLESIGVETGGKNYQVGDKVVFNNTASKGSGASAKVSRLLGKSVSSCILFLSKAI